MSSSRAVNVRTAAVLAAVGGLGILAAMNIADANAATKPPWVVGVSNTLAGNGWREEMICAVKAESLANGNVKKVIAISKNGDANSQINDIRSLISQGANAIIINPSDREKLNPVIAQAQARGIVVVAVDQAVTAKGAYVVTNDQVAYGRLGAEWLFKKLGGKGNVVEMRGISGVPADTDRHVGFQQALKKFPGIKVVKETFTGWQYGKGGTQARDLLTAGTKIDGIWTSGIDYTVVNAFRTAKKPFVPVVGADNNGFMKQVAGGKYAGLSGAVVTNPATIGGVGTSIALDVLAGKTRPTTTLLKPAVWDSTKDKATIAKNVVPGQADTYSARTQVAPYTHYSVSQLTACKGPGE